MITTNDVGLAMILSSLISMLGDGFIIASYFVIKNISDKIYMRLVFLIALSDLFSSIGSSIGSQVKDSNGCIIQAVASNSFALTSIFWTVNLTGLLYNIVMYGKAFKVSFLNKRSGLIWLFPILLTLLPLSTNIYSPSNGKKNSWCFIDSRNDSPKYGQLMWIWLSFYLWVWLSILYILTSFVSILRKIRNERSHTLQPLLSRQFEKCWAYPFVLIICWTLPTISDVWIAVAHENSSQGNSTFLLFASVLPLLHGLLTALIFVWYNHLMLVKEWGDLLSHLWWNVKGARIEIGKGFEENDLEESDGAVRRHRRQRASDAMAEYTAASRYQHEEDLRQVSISGSYKMLSALYLWGTGRQQRSRLRSPGGGVSRMTTDKDRGIIESDEIEPEPDPDAPAQEDGEEEYELINEAEFADGISLGGSASVSAELERDLSLVRKSQQEKSSSYGMVFDGMGFDRGSNNDISKEEEEQDCSYERVSHAIPGGLHPHYTSSTQTHDTHNGPEGVSSDSPRGGGGDDDDEGAGFRRPSFCKVLIKPTPAQGLPLSSDC